MNVRQKQILPKVQMTINGLLSQLQTTEVNFEKSEFSLQIKNGNLLVLNWYEPDLQDIQWSVEFMGIKSIKHVSVSVSISTERKKRVKLLFWRIDALHFLEGEVREKQSSLNLRKSLLRNEKIIPLNLLNTDYVVSVSEDLFPQQRQGVFLISTVQNHLYILRANSSKQELIPLNAPNKISQFLTLIRGLGSSMIDEIQPQSRLISNLLIRSSSMDKESFKTLILQDFQVEVRFINIPFVPGDRCKHEILLLHSIDLRDRIMREINLTQNLILEKSALYQLSDEQAGIIHLLRNPFSVGEEFVVFTIFDFQKYQVSKISHLKIQRNDLRGVQFQIITDLESQNLILKETYQSEVILKKIDLKTFAQLESVKLSIQGNSLLSKCLLPNQSLIFLLTPFKIFVVDLHIPQEQTGIFAREDSDSVMEEQDENLRYGQVKQIRNFLSITRAKIQSSFKDKDFQQAIKQITHLIQKIGEQLHSKNLWTESQAHVDELNELLKSMTSLQIYKAFVNLQTQSSNKLFEQISFNDLQNRNRFSQINSLFDQLIKKSQDEFLSIWIEFLQSYRGKDYFKDSNIRQTESNLLNENFSYQVNRFLEKNSKQTKNREMILKFIRMSSGILKIQRDQYRKLLQNVENLHQLKQMCLKAFNFDLLIILYFQKGQLSLKDIESYFTQVKTTAENFYEKCVRDFVEEYLSRMKNSKEVIHKHSRNLMNIIVIFKDNLNFLYKLFEEKGSNLEILFGLRLGERQKVRGKISQLVDKIKNQPNKQKLDLTIQDLKMDEKKLQKNKNHSIFANRQKI